MITRRALAAATMALGAWIVHPVHAEPYPARPVKIIVPTVAGGTVDVITRLTASELSARLGTTSSSTIAAGPATRWVPARPRAATQTAIPC
jgi:tripartite-type tricarboxylate transporter receptor subunit TctC